MRNTLFCSPTHLRVVCGDASRKNVTIKRIAEIPLPEGGLSGGLIANENVMIGFFSDVMKKYGLDRGETTLIIENSRINIKKINVPELKYSHVIDRVKSELGAIYGQSDTAIYDYSVTDGEMGENGYTVLAVSAQEAIIEPYVNVILAAGLNLRSIIIGQDCRAKAERIDLDKDVTLEGDAEKTVRFSPQKYLMNIGALIVPEKNQRDTNLMHTMEHVGGKPHTRRIITAPRIIIAVIALLIIAFGIYYFVQKANIQSKIDSATTYLNSEEVKADYESANEAIAQTEQAKEKTSSLETATNDLASYPNLTSAQLQQVMSMASAQKTSLTSLDFDINTGTLSISGLSESSTYVTMFVSNLRADELFSDVNYDGYTSTSVESKDKDDKTTAVKYEFTIRATVKTAVTADGGA